jgi:hypothetical protein
MHIFQLCYIYTVYSLIFSNHGVGKKIKIVILEVDHLHGELGHARVVASLPFSNPFSYKHG